MSLFSAMDNFRGLPVSEWMANHLEIPTLATAAYFYLILAVPNKLKDQPPRKMKQANIVWNLFLTLFSMIGAYYCVPMQIKMIFADTYTVPDEKDFSKTVERHGSLYNAVCEWYPTQFYAGRVGLFVCLFILSKIPEMIDTVFLVFKKKNVIFLHWYHHITVMLYCWHSYVYHISAGLFFSSMNYFVHSIMYLYYFLAECGYSRQLRPFAPIITFLQIGQMVLGGFVEVYSLYQIYFTERGCPGANPCNCRLGFLMYASYFVLFSQLFFDKYLSKKKPAPKKVDAVESAEKKEN